MKAFLFILKLGGEGQGVFDFEKLPAGFTLNRIAEAHYWRPAHLLPFGRPCGPGRHHEQIQPAGGLRGWAEEGPLMRSPCCLALHPRPGAPGSESRQAHGCPAKAAPRSPLPSGGRGNPRCLLGSEAYFPREFTGSIVLEGPQSPPKPVLGQMGKRLVRGPDCY